MDVNVVTCQVCGRQMSQLGRHIKSHGLTCDDYKARFPGAQMTCERIREGNRINWTGRSHTEESKQLMSSKTKGKPKSEAHKSALKSCGSLFGHGKEQPPGHMEKLAEIHRTRKHDPCSDQTKAKIAEKVKVWANSEAGQAATRKGMIASIRSQIRMHWDGLMNGFETEVKSILGDKIRFTGDGSLWFRFQDGRQKNPDFVVEPFETTMAVIECHGSRWHTRDTVDWLVDSYSNLGLRCYVIWDDTLVQQTDDISRWVDTVREQSHSTFEPKGMADLKSAR